MKKTLLLTLSLCLITASAQAATVTWVDNSNNEEGFRVERMVKKCTAPDAFTEVGFVAKNIVIYLDSTTQIGNEYCYRVRAWNLKFATDPLSIQYSGYTNKGEIGYPLPPPSADPNQIGVTP